jgi:hypothetical protein
MATPGTKDEITGVGLGPTSRAGPGPSFRIILTETGSRSTNLRGRCHRPPGGIYLPIRRPGRASTKPSANVVPFDTDWATRE